MNISVDTLSKVVSPKRTLGSGPVLVGKLETVAEKELETTQLETSLSNSGRDSIQANSIHSGHSRNKSLNTSLSQTNSQTNNQSTTSKSPAGSRQAGSMTNSINTSYQHETSLQSADSELQPVAKSSNQIGNQTQTENDQFVVMRPKQPKQPNQQVFSEFQN